MKNMSKIINESSLSRLYKHNQEHDCGAMTAFRKAPECGNGTPYTRKENGQRNKQLTAKLKSLGYGITKLMGNYPEGGKTQKEVSFFVVDLKDNGNLLKDLKKLGAEFEQDSVLFMPKGAIQGEAKAFLIGTNKCDNNWLSFGAKETFKTGKMGKESPIYTSKVGGRPFIFEEVGSEIPDPTNGFGYWAMKRIAEGRWQDIDMGEDYEN